MNVVYLSSTKRPWPTKSIDAVMEAQKVLVEVMLTLRQVVCAKGQLPTLPQSARVGWGTPRC